MRLTGFCRVLQLSVLQACNQYHPCFTTLVEDHSVHTLKCCVSQCTRYKQSELLADLNQHDPVCVLFRIPLFATNQRSHTCPASK